jgi:hypothetical protein
MAKLHLSSDFSLPDDAITQTFGILAVRGAGKTNCAVVMAEEMHRAGLAFVAIDPVGVWWGLRSTKDGKPSKIDVLVFGGPHGDVPLEKTGGTLVADLVVEQRLSAVLDLQEFSEGDKIRFLIDFADRLYRKNKDPLHLFLDEADDYIPQRPMREQARLLRSFENVVRRGRSRGLGMTMISQRSAALNKNVLTQIEVLIAMRTTSPQDRKAIESWIEYHGQATDVLESLSAMERGEAWVWSPGWLGIMKRIQVRERYTYDSSATPTMAGTGRTPPTLATIDLAAIKERMADTIERSKQEDPKELRRRIADLEKQVRAKPQTTAPAETVVEVPVLKNGQLDRAEKAIERGELMAVKIRDFVAEFADKIINEVGELKRLITPAAEATKQRATAGTVHRNGGLDPQPRARPETSGRARLEPLSEGEVGHGGLRRMLVALAQRRQGLSATQLGVRSQLSSKSGTFATYLGSARKFGWIVGKRGVLEITDAGLAALGGYDPLPTGEELFDYWIRYLGNSGAARMLAALGKAYPRTLTAQEVADIAFLESDSGTFATYLGTLRKLELVEGGRDALRASEEFFT